MNSLARFASLVEQRLSVSPENGYYLTARAQVALIELEVTQEGRLSQATYARLTLGVMCAREVELIDMAFCEAAYAMLDEVRPADDRE